MRFLSVAITLLFVFTAIPSRALAQGVPIYVPDLSGRTLDQAVMLLERSGLQRGSVIEQPSGLPAGTVISQFPRAGTSAQPRERVDIVLAESRSASMVPDVTGGSMIQAEEILRGLGLRRGVVTREQSFQLPGTVISQSPRPGTPAQPGMTVDLVVAADRPEVPDLTGRDLQRATDLLREAGLARGIVYTEPSKQPAGTVISQFPRPGTTVQPLRMVDLTIASAEKSVPDERAHEEPSSQESDREEPAP